jgi:hypothetical protein
MLDRAITDKRLLEKKSKLHLAEDKEAKSKRKSTNKGLWSYNSDDNEGNKLPRRVIPIYKAGDVIKGSIVLSLNKSIDAAKLVVGLQGRSFVQVRCYHSKGYFDVTGEETFVREKKSVWERISDKGDVGDQMSLLAVEAGIAKSSVLAEGSHSFPFEFSIPTDVPQSAPPMVISTHNKGYLMYRIKAAIDQQKTGGFGNIVIHKGIWIQKEVDIAQDPKNLERVHVEETLETNTIAFWKSGKITVRATMEKPGCLIGQPVPIRIEICNESNGEINAVSACIRMYGKARQANSRAAAGNTIDVKSEKVKEGAVAVGMNPVYSWVLPWDFSNCSVDGNLLPVGDLNDSKLLDINYEINIKLKRKALHRNMELHIPIFVGSTNSKAEPN